MLTDQLNMRSHYYFTPFAHTSCPRMAWGILRRWNIFENHLSNMPNLSSQSFVLQKSSNTTLNLWSQFPSQGTVLKCLLEQTFQDFTYGIMIPLIPFRHIYWLKEQTSRDKVLYDNRKLSPLKLLFLKNSPRGQQKLSARQKIQFRAPQFQTMRSQVHFKWALFPKRKTQGCLG